MTDRATVKGKTDKPCTTCKYYRDIGGFSFVVHACAQEDMYDPADNKRLYRRCSAMRSNEGACGVDGLLFEPA